MGSPNLQSGRLERQAGAGHRRDAWAGLAAKVARLRPVGMVKG